MQNQLKLSSSPYFSSATRGSGKPTHAARLDENAPLFYPKTKQVSEQMEEYYGYTQHQTSLGNIGQKAGKMRTRSSSESTTMSNGMNSPRSSGQQIMNIDYQDFNTFDEAQLQQKQIIPSTPFLHKYKTELCKNWELDGNCIFGETCSFAHGIDQLQTKVDLPSKYKTKLCRKFYEELYCPYGVRCQFIHTLQRPSSDQESEFLKNLRIQQLRLNAVPNVPPYSEVLSQNLLSTVEAHIYMQKFYGKQSDICYVNAHKTKRLSCFQKIWSSNQNNNLSAFEINESPELQQQTYSKVNIANYQVQNQYLYKQGMGYECTYPPSHIMEYSFNQHYSNQQ